MSIDLVVFDIAGTTLNEGEHVYRVLHQCVTERGAQVTEEQFREWMGTEKRAAITNLLRVGGVNASEAMIDAAYADFTESLQRAYAEDPPVPFSGVPELIADLRAGDTQVALSTGFSTEIATALLQSVGWDLGSMLDAVVCADQVPAGRPAPYMIHQAMQRTGSIDVHAVLAAGDTVADLRAAHHAGVHGVGVLTGAVPPGVLAKEPNIDIIDSLADLPQVLQQLDSGALDAQR